MRRASRLALTASGLVLAAALAGCATAPMLAEAPPSSLPKGDPLDIGAQALLDGRLDAALAALGEAAAFNPRDPDRQTLLGLAHHLGAGGDPAALEMAMAGYDLAGRSGRDAFWASALAGRAAFDRGRYPEAQAAFARAVTARPADPRGLLALAVASYHAGDLPLAGLAAARARALGGDAAAALRIEALAAAGQGDGERAGGLLKVLAQAEPAAAGALGARVDELARTAAVDVQAQVPEEPQGEPSPQISIDVAIVLSQTVRRDRVGLNLLDGLRLNYGYDSRSQETRAGGLDPYTRTITDAITIPQLSYNLNIFNRFGQHYQVVARPMLTAYRGETSEFFVGRSVKVQVSGVNLGSLENIDIGTQVKVTPTELTDRKVKVRIEVTRSFLSMDPAGSFSEALTTFRQSVAATAEVEFGKTLILSGLSEAVRDSTGSKTPVLGDAPVLGAVFNDRNTAERRDAVLILITPSAPQTTRATPWSRPEAVGRLIDLWSTVIAPGSDLSTISGRLHAMPLFRRGRIEDAQLVWPNLRRDNAEIVHALVRSQQP